MPVDAQFLRKCIDSIMKLDQKSKVKAKNRPGVVPCRKAKKKKKPPTSPKTGGVTPPSVKIEENSSKKNKKKEEKKKISEFQNFI